MPRGRRDLRFVGGQVGPERFHCAELFVAGHFFQRQRERHGEVKLGQRVRMASARGDGSGNEIRARAEPEGEVSAKNSAAPLFQSIRSQDFSQGLIE